MQDTANVSKLHSNLGLAVPVITTLCAETAAIKFIHTIVKFVPCYSYLNQSIITEAITTMEEDHLQTEEEVSENALSMLYHKRRNFR